MDFPRAPIPNNLNTFSAPAAKGAALGLHLVRLPGSGGVGGAGGAAILVKPGEQGVTQQGVTSTPDQVSYDERQGRVFIAPDCFFAGIDPERWKMQIGGYFPLQKWLKDRKGRTLVRRCIALHAHCSGLAGDAEGDGGD